MLSRGRLFAVAAGLFLAGGPAGVAVADDGARCVPGKGCGVWLGDLGTPPARPAPPAPVGAPAVQPASVPPATPPPCVPGVWVICLDFLAPGSSAPAAPPERAGQSARRALDLLAFPTVTIHTAPVGDTVVHLPTSLWVSAGDWRPLVASARLPGREVTLTATPVAAVWHTGEATVRCAGPGGPDTVPPAGCSYAWHRSSADQPGDGADRAYLLTADIVYRLRWACAGACDSAAGALPDQARPTRALRVRVLERQVVVLPGPTTA